MAFSHKFGQVSLVCHSFNKDATEMAISLNSNDVFIFLVPKVGNGKFSLLDRLQQHTATVRSIDWAPKTDRIVSCSTDRNAYVWTRSGKSWKPTLVILQLNRAATFVRWSPSETKFAVGSGAKVISVCCFEADNDFWVSKHLKKGINSTVTCLDWHPNSCLLACGSTDFKVRIYCAFLKSSDHSSPENSWGSSTKFNTLLWEDKTALGWIHAVSFSNDGNKLAWSCHSSIISLAVATTPNAAPIVSSVNLEILPLLTLSWIGSNTVVAGGHDCVPYVFTLDSNNNCLIQGPSLDSKDSTDSGKKKTAKAIFQQIDKTATETHTGTLNSKHQNTINEIRIMKGTKDKCDVLSTVGRDGQIVLWDLKTLEQRMSDLKIF